MFLCLVLAELQYLVAVVNFAIGKGHNTNKSLEEMKETKAEQETQQIFRDAQGDYQPLAAYL